MQALRVAPDNYDPLIERVYIGESDGWVLLHGGAVVPITNYIGVFGEECPPTSAVAVVAGPVPGRDLWLAIDLQALTPQDAH